MVGWALTDVSIINTTSRGSVAGLLDTTGQSLPSSFTAHVSAPRPAIGFLVGSSAETYIVLSLDCAATCGAVDTAVVAKTATARAACAARRRDNTDATDGIDAVEEMNAPETAGARNMRPPSTTGGSLQGPG